jgi:hypothetical protein
MYTYLELLNKYAVNAKVATDLGSIRYSEQQIKQWLIKYKKYK